jgi:RND family efflux transporter MFP subunit
MRFVALVLVFAVASAAPTADPPKIDLKKGVEFRGRAEKTVVEVRARVGGTLERILMKDGEFVRKGDLLAELDDRAFKLDVTRAKARLTQAEADVKVAVADMERLKQALKAGIVAKEDVEKAQAALEKAEAGVKASKAEVELTELKLSWTKLTAPVDGRLTKFVVLGTQLIADGPGVVAIVVDSPVTVVFDADEATALALRRAKADGGKPSVAVGLSDEDGFPRVGTLDAADPVVDARAGTVRFRVTVDNPKDLIAHGSTVRIRLTVQPGK